MTHSLVQQFIVFLIQVLMLPPPLLAFFAAPALLIALRLFALILLACRPTKRRSASLAASLPIHGLVI